MTTVDFITERFCQVDDRLKGVPKHPQACLWPSEVVTLARLHALKGVGNRAFYRWLVRDYRALFTQLPERTRLFRRFKPHWRWSYAFMAEVTLLGAADTDGIERLHPIREGRRAAPLGRKGVSNHRWMGGSNSGCCSTAGAWWWGGFGHRPISMMCTFHPCYRRLRSAGGSWRTVAFMLPPGIRPISKSAAAARGMTGGSWRRYGQC